MSRIPKLFLSSVAGLVLFLSVPALAKADSFTAVFLGTQPSGVFPGSTQFNYNLVYTAAGGALQSGDFITFYDVPAFAALAPANFSGFFSLTGVTPPGVSPTDDPALLNLTIRYIGPTITTSQTFTGFWISSSFSFTQTGIFADQTHGATGALVGQLGSVTIPSATSPVPEPATILLLGTGLVGIAAKMRKRRKTV